ncbi:TPA: oligosaccharide flippase family protein [Vibrio alginolyticus]|uniref:lipopolysaccharide biosynthesis protein n=1 Tax=Vibrio alginolyticus TaxID=663 RepID=UPI001BD5BF18|nr:oligosaccharide flippase family protein [Vibrio alginolyticus]MBS9881883.1 oligosaccharide flippase family protein [Vibrio alginolyticus]MCR9896950.1 oligosaccharide flippase family protein [Vibrio alginolyticus]
MNRRKLVSHIVGPGLTAAITFVTLPILSAFYSVDDIGRFSMLQLAVNLSVILFSVGLHQAYVREYFESNNRPALTSVLISIPTLLFIICILLVEFTGIDISLLLFDKQSNSLSILALFCILGGVFTHLTNHILRMEEKISSYAVMLFMPKLTVLIVSLFFIFHYDNLEFKLLVYALFFASCVSILFSLYLNRLTLIKACKSGFEHRLAQDMLRFGSPLVIAGLAFWLLTAMDKLFLKEISTYRELGYYSIAVNFTAVITLFSTILMNIWNPIVYKWSAKKAPVSDYYDVMKLMLLVSLILWSLAGIFSWILPLILPNDLNSVESLFLLLIGGPILKLLSEVTKVGIGIKRKSLLTIIPVFVAVVVNGVLNYFLIPTLGAKGAAIASLFAFYALLVCRTELSRWVWNPFPRVKIYTICLIYLCMSIFLTEIVNDGYLRFCIWSIFLFLNIYFGRGIIERFKKNRLI